MSEFSCPVVRVEGITKHPNADKLSIVTVEGCPCIIITEDWEEGELGVYIPVEAVVPVTVRDTEFLGEHRRIKAKRLRGIFSMGLLLKADRVLPWGKVPSDLLGKDVSGLLGITKWEEPERGVAGNKKIKLGGLQAKDPKLGPVYDVESYRKYGKKVFAEGDYVIVTEKIHGTNFRFGHKTETKGFRAWVRRLFGKPPKTVFCVGSHKTWRTNDDNSFYWRVAKELKLEERTRNYPDLCFYGEIYGPGVQDLEYGIMPGELGMALFDIWDAKEKCWLEYAEFKDLCNTNNLPMVPVLYSGPFNAELIEPLRNGQSTTTLAKQIREGVVIRKVIAKNTLYNGMLKLVGEDYLLRKNGTEGH